MSSSVPLAEVQQLRSLGLTDALIVDELAKKGFNSTQVSVALAQVMSQSSSRTQGSGSQYNGSVVDRRMGSGSQTFSDDNFMPAPPNSGRGVQGGSGMAGGQDAMYSRFEEIAENIIDEKWDELLSEVKKIVEWKGQVEERLSKAESDLSHMKEDFKTLHQGVLGKLDEYDSRMREVGTDLKAVGKVFKDVVPQFVENVKELSAISRDMKGKQS